MAAKFTMYIGNDGAGADTNLAALNFFNNRTWDPDASFDSDVAALIAFAQYLLPAEDTYIKRIAIGGGSFTEHGQFDYPFPVTAYAGLEALDTNLATMTDYDTRYGSNALTARGTGAVMTRRTSKTGRHGRGRLTSPWLPVSWVNSSGALGTGGPTVIQDGWDLYMSTASGRFSELLRNTSETPFLTITSVTVSSRLGHVRSRTQ